MADLIGKHIGNYRVLRLLGKGGFADVYLAEHIHLNTMAAIKVLQTRLVGNAVEQFRDEARFVARLKHPHIIQILDFGVEDDTPYLIMEYAAQGTLRQRHPGGTPLQPATIVSYVRQVAESLQYAHNQKVIHRDIKPENMLLGGNNQVLLSDFGLAMTNPSSRQSTKELIGTIAYMSPEQIQGKPQIASDQYALGIVVYEWITGVRPFQGTFVELTVQHLSAFPPPMSQHIPTLQPGVENVVLKALAKDPNQRFGSVQAFAQALEQAYTATILQLDGREDASTIKATLSASEQERQPQNLSASSTITAWLSDTFGRTVLASDTLTIGRASDNQFVVNDLQVSGHHARIHLQSGTYRVTDLGSTNGTFVNEQRLAAQVPYQLNQGDVIRIGNTRYNYSYGNSPQISKIPYSPNAGVSSGNNSAPTVMAPMAPTIAAPSPMRITPAFIPPQPSTFSQSSKNPLLIWVGLGLAALLLLSIGFGIANAFAHKPPVSTSLVNTQLSPTPTSHRTSTSVSTPTPTSPSPTDTSTPVPTVTDTPTPTPTDTSTPVPTVTDTPTPTLTTIWKSYLDGSKAATQYNNYHSNYGYYYVVVQMTFNNLSSQTQILKGSMLVLYDSAGNSYAEDQVADTQQAYEVNPGGTVTAVFAFLTPDYACKLTLDFNDPLGKTIYWNLQFYGSSCRV